MEGTLGTFCGDRAACVIVGFVANMRCCGVNVQYLIHLSVPWHFYGANSANVCAQMPSVKGGGALVAGWVPCCIIGRRGPSKRQGKSRTTTDEYFLAF